MPQVNTSTTFASSIAAGGVWTTTGNVYANDTAVARDNWDNLTPTDTSVLQVGGFAQSTPGTPISCTVVVRAQRTNGVRWGTGTLEEALWSGGAYYAGGGSTALGTTLADISYTTALASSITQATLSGLVVSLYGKVTYNSIGAGLGEVLIDSVSMYVTYEQPNAYAFTAVTNQPLSTLVGSGPVSITGLTVAAPVSISVSTGSTEWRKNAGAWGTAAGTVVNGDTVELRHNTGAVFSGVVTSQLNIAGVTANFSTTATAADTIPDAFPFTSVSGQPLSTVVASNAAAISGINTTVNAAISINGGGAEWSKNSGAWGSASGTVVNGDSVQIRHNTGAVNTTTITSQLTIGGVTSSFSTTTIDDTIPNAFSFTSVTNQPLSTVVASNAVSITGINAASPVSISVSTGSTEWSKNGGAWGTAAGTVVLNDTVQLRHNTGGLFSNTATSQLNIGGVLGSFSTTTLAVDTTPDAFTFTPISNINPSTLTASNTITITGINSAASVSITGGEYSKNAGAWVSTAGICNNGDTFAVRGTSSASYSTGVNVSLTVGGVVGTYVITTRAGNTTPAAFTFTPVTGATSSTVYTSNTITVSGIEVASPLSFVVTGGGAQQYSISAGAWTNVAPTSIANGQTLAVRLTTTAVVGSTASIAVTIGGVSSTFSVTNANDSTPDAFPFVNTTAANNLGGVLYTSNAVTITGIDVASNVTFATANGTGHQYSINGGAWTALGATTITVGQTIAVRLTNTAGSGVVSSITVTIGGVVSTWSVTNAVGDTIPDAFTFVANPAAPTGYVTTSNTVTIAGIDTATTAAFTTGGNGSSQEYRKNGGAWLTLASDTVVLGDTFQVRLTAPATGQTASITMTIGGVASTYNTTAVAVIQVPAQFLFIDQTGAEPLTLTQSAPVTITGINAPAPISCSGSGGEYQVNSGAWTNASSTVSNNDTVTARLTTAPQFVTQSNVVVTIGGISDTFSVTTRAPVGVNQYVKTFRELAFGAAA